MATEESFDPRLTSKQSKVLGYLVEGLTPRQIAKRMKITRNGVYAHMRRLKDVGLVDENNHAIAGDGIPGPGGDGGEAIDSEFINGSQPEALKEVEDILDKARGVISSRTQEIDGRTTEIDETIKRLQSEREELTHERQNLQSRLSPIEA